MTELDPLAEASVSERQRLRKGPPSAGLAKLWAGAGMGADRWGRFVTGLSVFLGTLVLAAAVALVAGLLGGGAGHADSQAVANAHFYVVRLRCARALIWL